MRRISFRTGKNRRRNVYSDGMDKLRLDHEVTRLSRLVTKKDTDKLKDFDKDDSKDDFE